MGSCSGNLEIALNMLQVVHVQVGFMTYQKKWQQFKTHKKISGMAVECLITMAN